MRVILVDESNCAQSYYVCNILVFKLCNLVVYCSSYDLRLAMGTLDYLWKLSFPLQWILEVYINQNQIDIWHFFTYLQHPLSLCQIMAYHKQSPIIGAIPSVFWD
jgi:hypothetical protein